ncbi:hypothetical protein LWC05_13870 [Acetobacter sicerae]|uniref:Uncharacterized protein n=1 Tax=Acetobacter sicerae TaxID=85325 RepID=A0ABS8W0C8_9PROT|nr:hypothetical protein [Acetobacter sicerae]MCE0744965.1 hypothetical protein [Acetobacter sicerae]
MERASNRVDQMQGGVSLIRRLVKPNWFKAACLQDALSRTEACASHSPDSKRI